MLVFRLAWWAMGLAGVVNVPIKATLLQVVSSDGCTLACALNAACAVLMDAGIPMHHPFGEFAIVRQQ